MNIFEGSRRVAKAVAVLWIAGFAIAASLNKESVYVTYFVYGPEGNPLLLQTKNCDEASAQKFGLPYYKTDKGTNVSVSLCFVAQGGFSNGKVLIPYKLIPETNKVLGDERFSAEVKDYISTYAKNFQLPKRDFETLDTIASTQWWKTIRDGASVMFGGLFFLYTLTLGVGWIVRGFLNIPKGKDTK